MSNTEDSKKTGGPLAAWQTPSIHRVGNVGEVFQMPGGGKLSIPTDDTGDEQRKPKGQE